VLSNRRMSCRTTFTSIPAQKNLLK